jgi:uncharacterized protein YhbP (UPF0306 family)
MDEQRPPANVPPRVLTLLGEQNTLTLATTSPTGTPHAATLLYVNDGLALYCWTRPTSATVRHLEQHPTVAFTIDRYDPDWRKTRGIQGSGACQVLRDPAEIERVASLFRHKFPDMTRGPAADLAFLSITPVELRFIDNEAGAGEEGQADGQARQRLGQPYHRSQIYSVYAGSPQQEPAAAATSLESLQVAAGEVVVRQGSPPEQFFVVVDGELEVVREEEGESRRVATLRRGQFFGEMAILRDMPRTATVRAITAATLMTLERDAFRDMVAQSSGTTTDFDRVIQQRLSELGLTARPSDVRQ